MTDDEIKKRVEGIATINFSISKCPVKVYEDFVQFCKEETGDNYAFGLKMACEALKGNAKDAVLFQQYLELKERVDVLEEKLNEGKVESKAKGPKTFGSGQK